ncbi:V-type ATPase 116kDa subunit family protein, partial [mine drainage metagenome]
EEDRLLTERREVDDTVQLLERHRYYTGPLGALRSPRLLSFFGEATGEAFATLQTEVRALGEAAFVVGPRDAQRMVHFLVAVPREQADAVGRIAQQAGVHLASLPAHPGSIAEEVPLLVQRRTTIDLRLGAIRDRLAAIAAQWGARVVALEEAFEIENRKFEAGARMGVGRDSFALEGWVPKRHYEALERALRARMEERVHLYPIATDEEAPTLMDNPPGSAGSSSSSSSTRSRSRRSSTRLDLRPGVP